MRSYFILSMCLLSIIQYFVRLPALQALLAVSATAAFLGSATHARKLPRFFSVLMFAAGAALTLWKGEGIAAMAQGITANLPLLTLLVLVPLLSIPFKLGGFFDAILFYLKRLGRSPRKLFAGITSVLFVMGPILNLGAIRIVHELVKELRLNASMLSKAYLVGFSTTILWSPYYAAVGIVLLYLHVSVGSYMLYGFGLALLFLLVGNVLFGWWARTRPLAVGPGDGEAEEGEETERTHRGKIRRLPVWIGALMLITLAAEAWTHWSMLVLVSLLALLFPLVWSLTSGAWDAFRAQLIDFRDRSVPMMHNETMMYISAGFFGQALKGSSFGNGVSLLMNELAARSFLLFALFIVVTMLAVTFVGIHQVVVVTVLATQMDPAALGTSKEILAMVVMLAWGASSILSPVNPINLLVSGLVNKSSLDVGLRDNGVYLLVTCALGLAILTLIH